MSTYKAIIAVITETTPIKGADRIQAANVLGETVVVSKDWKVGDFGVFFPTDCQLSEEFCKNNNLYRDSTLNADTTKTGFFDVNRRVRAQPFLKVKSCGMFMSVDAFEYLGELPMNKEYNVGYQFDELDGHKICEKYISPQTRKAMNSNQTKKKKSVEAPLFHKHVDTDQFKYNIARIPVGARLSFHHKVHGTSARMSLTKVVRKPQSLWEKFRALITKVNVIETWEYLVGTRNVVLFPDQNKKEGHHGSEQFRFDAMEIVKPYLEKGMTIYGEIAGYANGAPIMGTHSTEVLKDKAFTKKYGKTMVYSYGCKEHEFRFHIYRISMTTEAGTEIDFTEEQCIQWCKDRELLYATQVHDSVTYFGDESALLTLVDVLTELQHNQTEDMIDPSHVSEGVVIRVDHGTLVPKFYKNKSYAFKVMEGIFKEDNVDAEDSA